LFVVEFTVKNCRLSLPELGVEWLTDRWAVRQQIGVNLAAGTPKHGTHTHAGGSVDTPHAKILIE